jgi:hypothetical protein
MVGGSAGDHAPRAGGGVSTLASSDDLDWWLELAPTLAWTWASTFARSAPHHYVHLGRTPGLSRDDVIRAGRVIRTFGEPGKFWRVTNLYLPMPGRVPLRAWVMWGSPPLDIDARTINVAPAELTYGPQTDFDQGRLDELRLGRGRGGRP